MELILPTYPGIIVLYNCTTAAYSPSHRCFGFSHYHGLHFLTMLQEAAMEELPATWIETIFSGLAVQEVNASF